MPENSIKIRRLYAIGDIHGRSDLLDSMVELIRADLGMIEVQQCITVTLGDYIDRGPDSRGVLDRLARNPFPTPYVALKGNHEELFESFLRSPVIGRSWRQLGGLETLHSYGIPVRQLMVGDQFEEASKALRSAVPDTHFAFLSSLKTWFDWHRYFLCHAGVRPGVPFDRQRNEDLLWIRDEFLNSQLNFGKIVVHGHSPVGEPEDLANRINIDTGAFATGRLTCVVLEGEGRRFLTT